MKKLNYYNDYIFDMIFEANDTFRLYLSEELMLILKSINNKIAKNIINISNDNDNINQKITYLDINKKNPEIKDSISFIQSNKVISNIAKKTNIEIKHEIELSPLNKATILYYGDLMKKNFYKNKSRSNTSIGRIVNKLFPNKYNETQIEEFVNLYKAKREKNIDFEIVKGKDIQYWYDETNYVDGGGSLNKSCMKYKICKSYLKLYAINPDKVSMLILKDEDDNTKIKGRAILWKLDSPSGRTFMDRIYTVNDAGVNLFKDYALEKKWLFKTDQNAYQTTIIDIENENSNIKELVINNLNDSGVGYYPYMDTLKYFDGKTLSNCINLVNMNNVMTLEDTDGNYVGYGEWSDFHQRILSPGKYVIVYTKYDKSKYDYREIDMNNGRWWIFTNKDGIDIRFSDDVSISSVYNYNEMEWDKN